MCGIAGFYLKDSSMCERGAYQVVSDMCSAISYRGPDDRGIKLFGFSQECDAPKVGLGHNRLSIIDLTSAGHQPMANEDGSVWLTFNGEIYNFLELKDQLLGQGHVFKSRSDTEVIIHSYEEWGRECVSRFNGMFAFGLWDAKRRSLLFARDRMGKKPLYYYTDSVNIIFASEPKAILRFPGFYKEMDHRSLRKYFLYEYAPSPHTVYKNIFKLEAGNTLVFDEGKVLINKYWDISFSRKGDSGGGAKLRSLLEDSVEKRLISDVPLGVFLSAGIDSSTVTSFAAKISGAEKIKTFSIGFEDKGFDESVYAKSVADYFKTEHRQKILDPGMVTQILPEVMGFLDEPFADASIIPTYLLSKFTREHVKVALGGDGGDELFAGYPTFAAHKLAGIYQRLPGILKRFVIDKVVRGLPVSYGNISFDFKLKQFLKGMPYPPGARNQVWLGSFAPYEQKDLFNKEFCVGEEEDYILEDIDLKLNDCDSSDIFEKIMYLYFKFYLQDDILAKVDRASMACSLEVRAPFLDYRIVELACSLPFNEKLKGFTTKYILKKAMRGHLPKSVINRPKKGFGMPVGKWIRQDLKSLITDELSSDKIKKEGLLNPVYIQRLLEDHFKGRKDNRKQIWTVFMFELWHDKWFKNN